MVDTTTTVLGLVKQTVGGNRNTWGGILNSAMDLIEGAFYGMTSKLVTGAADVTLTDAERRKRILNFTGTLAANQTIIVENLVGFWRVRNGTTGNFSLSMKTTAGTAIVIPQGGHCDVWCDGSDVMYAGLSTRLRDTQMLAPDGSLAAPGLGFASETGSGWHRVSAGLFAFIVGGIKIITVTGTALRMAVTDTGVAITGALSCSTLTVGGETIPPIGAGMDYDGIEEPNGWKWRNGQALSRTTYALLLAALTKTCTGDTNGTNTISNVSADLRGKGLVGAYVEGTGIPSGTTLTDITATTFTMSAAATGSGAGVSLRILPHGQGDGSTTFNVPDDKGRINPGRDDMGGTSANRLTGQTGGIDGDKLGSAGGEETNTLTTAKMPAHTHSITDVQHNHNGTFTDGAGSPNNVTKSSAQSGPSFNALIFGGAAQNLKTPDAYSGITGTNSTGSGEAHNNVQPSRITNKIIFTGVFA